MGVFSQKELEYLREQGLGRLATVSRKQIPQVTPLAFSVDEDRVYVNIKHTSKKARNIRSNPRVSFVVDDSSPWCEAIGQLLDVCENTLIFDDFVLLISPHEFDSIDYIKGLIGEVVSILRTDIPGNEYIVREHHPQGLEKGQPPVNDGCVRDHDMEATGK